MNEYPLCEKCFDEAIQDWVNQQCSLDDLIKRRYYEYSKEKRMLIKTMILELTKKYTCNYCSEFFLSDRFRKYCDDSCKQKAYRERSRNS